MQKTTSLLALAAALVLGGCASLHTPYSAPTTATPSQWAQGTSNTAPVTADPWWQAFNDPQLTQLIDAALLHNNDLAAAALRVRQAQLQAGMAASDLLPTPSASISSGTSRPLDGGSRSRSSGANVGLAYEVDLWGCLAKTRDAQQWEAEATQQDRQATALALAGTTAGLYWQLAYLNERIASSDQSLAYTTQTLALVQAQYQAGAVSALELREAESALAGQTAARTQLVQQRVAARNALAILFDAAPGDTTLASVLPTEPLALPTHALPAVAAGLPAELLARRPDLRAAEARLRETLAQGDASRASYYPTLSLTGALGSSSASLLNLVSNPVLSLGAGLTLPFLKFNEMRLNSDLVKAQYAEAATRYRQTLYTAFAEVEDALSARTQLALQGSALTAQLQAASEVERLYQVRYRLGATTLKVWLDAQEKRRAAELAVSANRLDQLNNQVTLYKALGGNAASDAQADQPLARIGTAQP